MKTKNLFKQKKRNWTSLIVLFACLILSGLANFLNAQDYAYGICPGESVSVILPPSPPAGSGSNIYCVGKELIVYPDTGWELIEEELFLNPVSSIQYTVYYQGVSSNGSDCPAGPIFTYDVTVDGTGCYSICIGESIPLPLPPPPPPAAQGQSCFAGSLIVEPNINWSFEGGEFLVFPTENTDYIAYWDSNCPTGAIIASVVVNECEPEPLPVVEQNQFLGTVNTDEIPENWMTLGIFDQIVCPGDTVVLLGYSNLIECPCGPAINGPVDCFPFYQPGGNWTADGEEICSNCIDIAIVVGESTNFVHNTPAYTCYTPIGPGPQPPLVSFQAGPIVPVNIIVDEECAGEGEEYTIEQEIFIYYPWLGDIVDPNNCATESITTYESGAFTFLLIETANSSTLYFEDGTYYCADAPNFSCVEAYGLSNGLVSWACPDIQEPAPNCPQAITASDLLSNPDVLINTNFGAVIIEHYGPTLGYFYEITNICPQPVLGAGGVPYASRFYDCNANFLCSVGGLSQCGLPIVEATESNIIYTINCDPSVASITQQTICVGESVEVSAINNYLIGPNSANVPTTYNCLDNPIIQIFPSNGTTATVNGFLVSPSTTTVYQITETSPNNSCPPKHYYHTVTVDQGCEEPEIPITTPAIFETYTWLNNIVDYTDCDGTSVTVYNTGNYAFIIVSNPTGSTMYFQDGTYYCADASNFSCVEAYGLTSGTTWLCSDVEIVEPTPVEPEIFPVFPWLNDLVNNSPICLQVTIYEMGIYNFVHVIEQGSEYGTLYFQDGTFYCADSPGFSCVEAYDFPFSPPSITCLIEPELTAPVNVNSFLSNCFENGTFEVSLGITGGSNLGVFSVSPAVAPWQTLTVANSDAFTFVGLNIHTENGVYELLITDTGNGQTVSHLVDVSDCLGGGPPTEPNFLDFPWLNEIVDVNGCEVHNEVIAYHSGIYTFVYVAALNGLGTLYFQDGTLYCNDAFNFSCVDAYGLTTMDSEVLWSCFLDRPAIESCTPVLTPVTVCLELEIEERVEDLILVEENAITQILNENCFRYTPMLSATGSQFMTALVCNENDECIMKDCLIEVGTCEEASEQEIIELENALRTENNVESIESFTMYPNPSNGQVVIDLNTDWATGQTITIFDLIGNPLKQVEVPANSLMANLQLDLSDLGTGFYLVEWKTAYTKEIQQLIIE